MAKTEMATNTTIAEMVSLDRASDEFAQVRARRDDLSLQAVSIEQETVELARELRRLSLSEETRHNPIDRAAEARVSDLIGDVVPSAVKSAAKSDDFLLKREALNAKQRDLDDLKRAIDALDARLRVLHGHASAVVCEKVAPLVRERIAAVARSLIAASAAQQAYDELADVLNSENVWWSQLAHPPVFLDSPRDRYGRVAHYLRAAVEKGAIGAEEIPEALR
ncbi:hypothetical protein IYW40_07180 [Methylocystis sp. H4A]|uniref:hypothetical protein n=1 Tax=Methylocystis sp. H4A TaxID=2785788 RepID=UPI0018C26470|nr:hypothetical protein [Methylocystis sp. H4A]MBG0801264.1 hypothetical protein [Methylocystis sp. H4A]